MTDPERLLARLDLPRKVRLLSGADMWSTPPEPEIGLRRMVLSDGPAGVRGESWDERDPSVSFPSPTALAATWDEDEVARVGAALAAEASRKGVHVLLGPTINLHRSPRGGRHFECLSEDPLLTGRIAASYVRAVQQHGIGATPKHYVANDSETERFTVDARIDERTLREVYLAPFEDVVRSGAWLVMAAYNSVNGATMTENELLREPLKGAWGFDGVVVSDWFAVRSTTGAAAGTDLAMPGPSQVWGEALLEAVRGGRVPESAVDDKVRRLLRLAARVGALDDAQLPAEPGSRAEPSPRPETSSRAEPAEDPAAVSRRSAAAGSVLLRNENSLLPLARSAVRKVAVLGPNAADARIQGGGSAEVVPPRATSPLEGVREAAGAHAEITHAPGVRHGDQLAPVPAHQLTNPDTGERGMLVHFRDADGAVLRTEHRATSRLVWVGRDELVGVAGIEVRARFRAERGGAHRLGVAGVGRYRFTAADRPLVDAVIEPEGSDPVEALLAPPQRAGEVPLQAGEEVELFAAHELDPALPGAILRLDVAEPATSPEQELQRAADAAAEADVAVVVVGTTAQLESEGFDRADLALPAGQDELVRRVAAANPSTAVVVNSGAPVELPWREQVGAILLSWFPGQEGGHALADVLFGTAEPGGRLPTTWGGEHDAAPIPSTRPEHGLLHYSEGLHLGYRGWARAGAEPAYPFGHGIGYTSWEHREITAIDGDADAGVRARVRVVNTGQRRGREVVQAYLSRPDSAVERPALWLAGFTPVTADPGEEVEVTVRIEPRAFRHWSAADGDWRAEPGTFALHIGRSSRDLPLAAKIAA